MIENPTNVCLLKTLKIKLPGRMLIVVTCKVLVFTTSIEVLSINDAEKI
jgi:hypothetical protein